MVANEGVGFVGKAVVDCMLRVVLDGSVRWKERLYRRSVKCSKERIVRVVNERVKGKCVIMRCKDIVDARSTWVRSMRK